VLTWKRVWDYNPLTDEGGGAASDEVLVSKISEKLAHADRAGFTGLALGLVTFLHLMVLRVSVI
jgi:hypothetical protein